MWQNLQLSLSNGVFGASLSIRVVFHGLFCGRSVIKDAFPDAKD